MKSKEKYEAWIHYNVSFIGGFIGVYTILARSGFFGSAQTSNLIELVKDICGRNVLDAMIRLGGLFIFIGAIVLTVWLSARSTVHLKLVSLIIDGSAILILGFLPEHMDPVLGLYPAFFAMAFQWCSFKGARGFAGASTFSTNNLRQFITGLMGYAMTKGEEDLDRARFFGATLLSFYAGVLYAVLLWNPLKIHSVWLGFLPLSCALCLVALESGWISAVTPKALEAGEKQS